MFLKFNARPKGYKGCTLSSKNSWEFCQLLLKNEIWKQKLNSLGLQKKHKLVGDEVNSNSKALRQFKFNPVLKNDAVFNSSLDLYASWPLKENKNTANKCTVGYASYLFQEKKLYRVSQNKRSLRHCNTYHGSIFKKVLIVWSLSFLPWLSSWIQITPILNILWNLIRVWKTC